MGITQSMAEEIQRARFEDIPEKAIKQVKALILDQVGLVYMGYEATGKELVAYARDQSSKGEAVIIRDGSRVCCELAAALNAQMTKDTDFEEAGPGLHSGPGVAHTALAVGQKVHASGKDVLAAATLGYEINCRFHYAKKDPSISPVKHLGLVPTVVAAKLLKLTPDQTNMAIGMSARWLVKKMPFKLKQISHLGIGNLVLCRYGIQSALLALKGFTDIPDYLDEYKDEYDPAILASSPTPYQYTADELQLKPWPASRFCHGALQLITEIIRENSLKPEEIDHITFKAPNIYLQPHQYDPDPRNYWEGIYSTFWSITMAVLGYEPGPQWFTKERFEDKVCRDFLKKVSIVEDPAATAMFNKGTYLELPNTVEVQSKKGTFTRSILMGNVLGSSGNLMPDSVLEGKFLRLTKPVIGEGRAQKLLSGLRKIEDVKDINELARLF